MSLRGPVFGTWFVAPDCPRGNSQNLLAHPAGRCLAVSGKEHWTGLRRAASSTPRALSAHRPLVWGHGCQEDLKLVLHNFQRKIPCCATASVPCPGLSTHCVLHPENCLIVWPCGRLQQLRRQHQSEWRHPLPSAAWRSTSRQAKNPTMTVLTVGAQKLQPCISSSSFSNFCSKILIGDEEKVDHERKEIMD